MNLCLRRPQDLKGIRGASCLGRIFPNGMKVKLNWTTIGWQKRTWKAKRSQWEINESRFHQERSGPQLQSLEGKLDVLNASVNADVQKIHTRPNDFPHGLNPFGKTAISTSPWRPQGARGKYNKVSLAVLLWASCILCATMRARIADEHSPENIHVYWKERPREDFKTIGAWKMWNARFAAMRDQWAPTRKTNS
jgi:hypothetical protein